MALQQVGDGIPVAAHRGDVIAERAAGDAVEVADSNAGMHLLAWLPRLRHAQVRELIERASTRGLGLYPIAPYYLAPQARQGLLLGYADLPAADLDAAMRIFGDCLRALLRP